MLVMIEGYQNTQCIAACCMSCNFGPETRADSCPLLKAGP